MNHNKKLIERLSWDDFYNLFQNNNRSKSDILMDQQLVYIYDRNIYAKIKQVDSDYIVLYYSNNYGWTESDINSIVDVNNNSIIPGLYIARTPENIKETKESKEISKEWILYYCTPSGDKLPLASNVTYSSTVKSVNNQLPNADGNILLTGSNINIVIDEVTFTIQDIIEDILNIEPEILINNYSSNNFIVEGDEEKISIETTKEQDLVKLKVKYIGEEAGVTKNPLILVQGNTEQYFDGSSEIRITIPETNKTLTINLNGEVITYDGSSDVSLDLNFEQDNNYIDMGEQLIDMPFSITEEQYNLLIQNNAPKIHITYNNKKYTLYRDNIAENNDIYYSNILFDNGKKYFLTLFISNTNKQGTLYYNTENHIPLSTIEDKDKILVVDEAGNPKWDINTGSGGGIGLIKFEIEGNNLILYYTDGIQEPDFYLDEEGHLIYDIQ